MVVEVAFGVAAWGVEEGSLSFGKIAVQQAQGHEHGFHSVAPVVLEELLECVLVAGCLPDGPGGFLGPLTCGPVIDQRCDRRLSCRWLSALVVAERPPTAQRRPGSVMSHGAWCPARPLLQIA